jgi:hypothetical protein
MPRNSALRWSLALLALAVLIAAAVAIGNSGGGEAADEGPYAEFNPLHEAANEGRARFEGDSGGEAQRGGGTLRLPNRSPTAPIPAPTSTTGWR